MQQHVSSFITPEQHDSLLISWSPHSTDKTATVIVRTIVKLHCCPIVKRLCKFQFRERGFAGNCTNLYLILPYDDFSGSSSAVRAESAVFDSKRDGAFTDKCTETKIFVLFFPFLLLTSVEWKARGGNFPHRDQLSTSSLWTCYKSLSATWEMFLRGLLQS